MIAGTPAPPYYAVIFTSLRTEGENGYGAMAGHMDRLAAEQPGYLGVESAREGLGITVSYWRDVASIRAWKANAAHLYAQRTGRSTWYSDYRVRIARVEGEYGLGLGLGLDLDLDQGADDPLTSSDQSPTT